MGIHFHLTQRKSYIYTIYGRLFARVELDSGVVRGYTLGMKTAVSIPDPVFEEAELLARKLGKSRSQLYAEALAAYVARHDPDSITEAMNRVCDAVEEAPDAAFQTAARAVLEQSEW